MVEFWGRHEVPDAEDAVRLGHVFWQRKHMEEALGGNLGTHLLPGIYIYIYIIIYTYK